VLIALGCADLLFVLMALGSVHLLSVLIALGCVDLLFVLMALGSVHLLFVLVEQRCVDLLAVFFGEVGDTVLEGLVRGKLHSHAQLPRTSNVSMNRARLVVVSAVLLSSHIMTIVAKDSLSFSLKIKSGGGSV